MSGLKPETLEQGQRPSRSAGRPRIADVAREAGVAPMTVSRVVNGEVVVRPETRDKVLRAIEKLGYVPNAAARALAAGSQVHLALLHNNPSAVWLSEVLVACLDKASIGDAQLLVERCDVHTKPQDLVRHLRQHRIDGVILPPPLCNDQSLIAALHMAGLPMAQIASGVPSPFADSVGVDDRAAAHAMTTALLSLGHERIGFIKGDPNQAASELRFEGHCTALAQAGLQQEAALIAQGDFSYRSGLAAAEQLLTLKHRPSAIFASNDDMAAAAVAIAHRNGLDVPGELSVCGFDDSAIATMIWPQLSTVRQPIAAMATRATELVLDALAARKRGNGRNCVHERLAFEILSRDSSSRH